MASDATKSKASKTLNDADIATYARRGGPGGGHAGTDADSHTDADQVATDHDAPVAAATDADTPVHTDKD